MRQIIFVWITHCLAYIAHLLPADYSPALLFAAAAAITQATSMCLPMLALYGLGNMQAAWIPRHVSKASKFMVPITGAFLLILLYANYTLFEMYGFFIDPFVVNILTTPGGTAALGASDSVYLTIAAIVSAIVIGLYLSRFVPLDLLAHALLPRTAVVVATLLVIFLAQAAVYAVSEHKSYVPVLRFADRIPWYQTVTAKSFLADIGVERSREVMDYGNPSSGTKFHYPESVPELLPLDKRYNIVWLVAESWRWDMLDPEIMPETWAFAQRSQLFVNHYSTGNGTRMGVFGQFYGLNGSFWFPALRYQRVPVLVDTLQKSGYNIQAYTSASFTYPEFDKTVWVNVENDRLHSVDSGMGWERDRKNVERLIEFPKQSSTPFFSFMFFESTHANYQFPKENEVESDYLPDFDYLATDIESSIGLIKNRYINSSNHLDCQLGRVFDSLELQGLLRDTVVIVTGDHGEEFMENGRWGHNSTFSQQQVRVPFLLYVPGMKGTTHKAMSSHMDIPATLLSLLKPGHNSRVYSMGDNLLSPDFDREYAVISDWHGDALVTSDHKYSMSPKANSRRTALSTIDDKPMDQADMPAQIHLALSEYMAERQRFSRPPSATQASAGEQLALTALHAEPDKAVPPPALPSPSTDG
ncbi:sulfatase-like hydrolase/transferase [Pseudohalioglobus lutimaris]|nr:sulfatase-like hydrolase/transferase [Pseudohalioglobus lutimaris]